MGRGYNLVIINLVIRVYKRESNILSLLSFDSNIIFFILKETKMFSITNQHTIDEDSYNCVNITVSSISSHCEHQ
jgi:hypothetical protein